MFIIFGFIQIAILAYFVFYLFKINKKPVVIFSNTVIFATILAIIKHLFINYLYHPGYPNSTFLFNPSDRFNDYINMTEACKFLDPYNSNNFLPSVYFPVSNLIFYGFYKISNNQILISMLLFTIIFLLGFFILLKMMTNLDLKIKILFFVSIFISYPVIFSIDRMNLEMYLFLFTLSFIFFYLKKKYFIAIIFLSFAICMKLYPILFLLLFLQEKNYKAIITTLVTCFILTFISLALFKGGIFANINLLFINLKDFNNDYASVSGLQHNSSMYGVVKIFFLSIFKYLLNYENADANNTTNLLLKIPYFIFVIIYFVAITSYILFIEKTLWKQVFLIITMTILLPHVSFDYKLLTIIISILLFIKNSNNEKHSVFYAVLFAFLLIPNSYFYIFNDVSIGVIINPIILLIITFKIVYGNKDLIVNKVSIILNNKRIIFN